MSKTIIEDNDSFRALWMSNLTLVQIGQILGAHNSTVHAAAKRYGYPPKPGVSRVTAEGKTVHRWSAAEDKTLRALIQEGSTYATIAGKMGRSEATIYEHVKKLGLKRPKTVAVHMGQKIRAEEADTAPVDTSLGGRLRDTKGRYAALAEIAAAQGWTHAQVQQRYHRARLGEKV